MMTILTSRRAVQSFFFLLLLAFSSYALASDSSISNESRRCSPGGKVHNRAERKLAVVPAPEPAVSGNAPSPSASIPGPPPAPPNFQPALIDPSGNTPGPDLPFNIPSPPPPPPPPEAPITSPILTSKQSKMALTLGIALGVFVFMLVSLSTAAYLKPEWLPCCQPRRSELMQYERHVPT